VAIQHMELPEVVLCEKCRNATWAAPQTEKDAARYRWLRNQDERLAVCDEETSYYGHDLDARLDKAIQEGTR
jgi:hypothetical protein